MESSPFREHESIGPEVAQLEIQAYAVSDYNHGEFDFFVCAVMRQNLK